jgi:hypothetical protein
MRVLVSALVITFCLLLGSHASAGELRDASATTQRLYPDWVIKKDGEWAMSHASEGRLIAALCGFGAVVAFVIAMSRMGSSGSGRRTRRIVRQRSTSYYY